MGYTKNIWKALVLVAVLSLPVSPAASGLTQICQSRLDYAEVLYGGPIFVTSAYRTEEHNKEVGGVKHSKHLTGEAIDIRMPPNSAQLAKLVWALTVAEFGGIGIYKNHVHADVRFIPTFWRE